MEDIPNISGWKVVAYVGTDKAKNVAIYCKNKWISKYQIINVDLNQMELFHGFRLLGIKILNRICFISVYAPAETSDNDI